MITRVLLGLWLVVECPLVFIGGVQAMSYMGFWDDSRGAGASWSRLLSVAVGSLLGVLALYVRFHPGYKRPWTLWKNPHEGQGGVNEPSACAGGERSSTSVMLALWLAVEYPLVVGGCIEAMSIAGFWKDAPARERLTCILVSLAIATLALALHFHPAYSLAALRKKGA